MRRAKVDRNHAEIVAALRQAGCSVLSLASIGRGAPDLLCGFQGRNVLLEVKTANEKLMMHQVAWGMNWNGPVFTVRTPEEAIAAVVRR